MQKYSPVSVVATVSLQPARPHSSCVLTSSVDDESIPTIRCLTCSEWHHRTCVSISEIKAQSFLCRGCTPVQKREESFVSLQSVSRGAGSDVLSSLSGDRNDAGSFRRNESSPRNRYSHRDQQDPRPISAPRSSYSGEDRNYDPQYSTPHRTPHGPKPLKHKLSWRPLPQIPQIRPTVIAPSPTAVRSSASISTGKAGRVSVGSGTYPSSSSPHTAPFSEAKRTRKQKKNTESQLEQFLREQETLQAERRLKSAGRRKLLPQVSGPSVPEKSTGPSTSSWGAGPPPWGPSIKPTATAPPSTTGRPSASTLSGKPRTGFVSSGAYPLSSSPHTASFSETKRTRKQQEFAESQYEQLRRAEEKLGAERRLMSAVFEHHERLWNRLNTLNYNELSWSDFPWPMFKQPLKPGDMTLPRISAYIQSPLYPDKDYQTRIPKYRIRVHINRWHPDRFETKVLPKVVENEREKVKHGAEKVAKYLSDLLRKENERDHIYA